MKIFMGKNIDSPGTGKGFFIQRLAKELSKYPNVEIIRDPGRSHDIALHISKIKIPTASKKNIIRIDGCIMDITKNYKKANKAFKKAFKQADGVIYQTNFCKEACNRFIGKPVCDTDVIFNGADIHCADNISPANKENSNVFITASRWRPQKRLKDIVETFLLADMNDSILYVAGDLSKSGTTSKWRNKHLDISGRVKYLGVLSQERLLSYLKISDAFIHLSWIDWCPNAVVEAISVGVPVICNNVGGTQELVRPSGGIVCDIDKPYNLKPCDLYSPPAFNRDIVISAMDKACYDDIIIDNSHVDIREIAKKYKKFFEKIIQK